MSPRRRVQWYALITTALLATSFAASAPAQPEDFSRPAPEFPLDMVDRSPALLGMGGLVLVGDDPHNRITLWDFAGHPIGIAEADTVSTMDLYPGSSMASNVEDISVGGYPFQRQYLSGHEGGVGYEVWRRTGHGRTGYGLAGDLRSLHTDRAFSDDVEEQTAVGQPSAMGVLTGLVPHLKSDRWRYALRLFYAGEKQNREYRSAFDNSQGEFIDENGTLLDTPNYFDPSDYENTTTGAGVGVGYSAGPALRIAGMVDGFTREIRGTNEAARHSSEVTEKRPYRHYQLSMVGRLGRSLDWGLDGRTWDASSEERWRFSVSAGIGQDPLTGRGKLLERDETGNALRARMNWTRGPLVVGARFLAGNRTVTITPPLETDITSLDHFLNQVYVRPNVDSLALPDSVVYDKTQEKAWEAGGGIGWHLPARRGLLGVEYHYRHSKLDQVTSGEGPRAAGWDVRGGLEYACTPVMTGRVGFGWRWQDADQLTRLNESKGQTLTLGLGLRPAGARWGLDAGYAIEWYRADYGSTLTPHGSRQQLASQIHWGF